MSKNLMVDIETLATDARAMVVQIGARSFDLEALTLGEGWAWDLRLDRGQQGRTIDGRTLQWWLEQSPEAFDSVLRVPAEGRVMARDAVLALQAVVAEHVRVWARGPSFDLAILNDLFATSVEGSAGPPRTWLIPHKKWRDERAIRDLLEVSGYGLRRAGTHHNALDDATHQAANVLRAYEILRSAKGAR